MSIIPSINDDDDNNNKKHGNEDKEDEKLTNEWKNEQTTLINDLIFFLWDEFVFIIFTI